MKKRYNVFVSSTDRGDERRKVLETILEMGYFPVSMDFCQGTDDTLIERYIKECDCYLLILTGRNGSVREEISGSPIQKEYKYVLDQGIPVIAFLYEDPKSSRDNRRDGGDKKDKLDEFIKKVGKDRCKYYTNADDLADKVSASLQKLIEDNPRSGWVKEDTIPQPAPPKRPSWWTLTVGFAIGVIASALFWFSNKPPEDQKGVEPNIDLVDTLNIRQSFESGMLYVEGGTFTMGSASSESGRYNDEIQHQVTLSSFYIGKYEVTQGQWKAVMGSNPSHFKDKGDNYPVENVSWNDIQTFLQKLNATTGENYRLPTEAEWEYASRGGHRSKGYIYSGSNSVGNVAWYAADNSGDSTHPVGQKSPNELGIYDMSGNVYEWCSDWYDSYSDSAQTNPTGPSSGSYRVLRGGSWYYFAELCRSAYRLRLGPGDRLDSSGFRVVVSP